MPMKLLAQLSRETLPASVTEARDVFNLHVLKASGYVYATIPLPHYALDGHWHRDPATVRQITPLGYTVLRFLGSADPAKAIDRITAMAGKSANADLIAFKTPPESEKVA